MASLFDLTPAPPEFVLVEVGTNEVVRKATKQEVALGTIAEKVGNGEFKAAGTTCRLKEVEK